MEAFDASCTCPSPSYKTGSQLDILDKAKHKIFGQPLFMHRGMGHYKDNGSKGMRHADNIYSEESTDQCIIALVNVLVNKCGNLETN